MNEVYKIKFHDDYWYLIYDGFIVEQDRMLTNLRCMCDRMGLKYEIDYNKFDLYYGLTKAGGLGNQVPKKYKGE